METEKQISDREWHELAVKAREECKEGYCKEYCILFDFAECPAVSADEYFRR